MNEIIFLVEEDPEGGFFARSIGESIFTQAETIAELRLFVRDAVNCHHGEQEDQKLLRLHIIWDGIEMRDGIEVRDAKSVDGGDGVSVKWVVGSSGSIGEAF